MRIHFLNSAAFPSASRLAAYPQNGHGAKKRGKRRRSSKDNDGKLEARQPDPKRTKDHHAKVPAIRPTTVRRNGQKH